MEGPLKISVTGLIRPNVDIYDDEQIYGANGLLYLTVELFVHEIAILLPVLLK
jgi:hypothetical protein